MEKQEFLMVLRQSLSGEVPEQEVENSIRYYEEYLTDEVNKTIEEKINELGEPRLIAKTIIDTYMINHETSEYTSEYFSRGYDEGTDENSAEENGTSQNKVKYYSWDTMAWYQKIIVIVVGAVIVAALVSLLAFSVNIFFSFILPLLLILFGVKMIMKLFH